MSNSQFIRGMAIPSLVAIIAVILIGGGLWYANTTKNEDMMDEKAGDMLENGEKMMKEGEAMMKEGDAMKKEGETMMTKDIIVAMGALSGSGETGKATLSDMNGKTKAVVDIASGAVGVAQPSHIHMGSCKAPGAILYPLTAVINGKAETILDVSLETIGGKLPLLVMVHKSAAEAKVFVSCGDLPKDGFGATMMEKKDGEAMMNPSTGSGQEKMMAKYIGTVLAGKSAPLLEFNKADYDAAIASDKLVVLYFYANWCPICKEEVANALIPAFNELTTDKVIGIRINYKDSDTDADEKSLAVKYGIPYQHTKVFVKNGKQILKAPDGWDKTRYTTEINKALAQ